MQTGVALLTHKYTDWGRLDRRYRAADPKIAGRAISSNFRPFARSAIPAIPNMPAVGATPIPAPARPDPTAVSS
jgi:hypothetical protein